jgi:hypothetical protein
MRPIATGQNPLRYPLNEVFGTQAHVRLLRVMASEVEAPLMLSDLAKRSGLTVPGTKKALERLVRSGFVRPVGGGRQRQYEIRRAEPLMQITIELFKEEWDRFDRLCTAIARAVSRLSPPPHGAWLKIKSEQIADPLTVGVLHDAGQLAPAKKHLRDLLNSIEMAHNVTLELEGYTKAEMADISLDEAHMLYGYIPAQGPRAADRSGQPLTHQERDLRLRDMARRLARAVERDASLVSRAKMHLERLLQEDQGAAASDLKEWRDILEMYPLYRLLRFLQSSSERADRLRQSNPFFAVLTPEERSRLEDGHDT